MGRETANLVLSAWGCPDRGVSLIVIYLYPQGTDETPGVKLLLDALCAAAGENVPNHAQPTSR